MHERFWLEKLNRGDHSEDRCIFTGIWTITRIQNITAISHLSNFYAPSIYFLHNVQKLFL